MAIISIDLKKAAPEIRRELALKSSDVSVLDKLSEYIDKDYIVKNNLLKNPATPLYIRKKINASYRPLVLNTEEYDTYDEYIGVEEATRYDCWRWP